MRPGRLRSRSRRRQRTYVDRRRFVAEVLDERPVCERCDRARSREVHELKSRARGGSILDKNNVRALCTDCHHFISTNPRQAEAEGFSVASWATTSANGDKQ